MQHQQLPPSQNKITQTSQQLEMKTCTYVLWQLLKVKRTPLSTSKAPSFGRRHSQSNKTFFVQSTLHTDIVPTQIILLQQ